MSTAVLPQSGAGAATGPKMDPDALGTPADPTTAKTDAAAKKALEAGVTPPAVGGGATETIVVTDPTAAAKAKAQEAEGSGTAEDEEGATAGTETRSLWTRTLDLGTRAWESITGLVDSESKTEAGAVVECEEGVPSDEGGEGRNWGKIALYSLIGTVAFSALAYATIVNRGAIMSMSSRAWTSVKSVFTS